MIDILALQVPAPGRRRRAALPLMFLLLGMVIATWASRIPFIRDALQLTPAQLGLVLLCGGMGAVLSFPLAAWLVSRFGGRRAAGYGGLWLLLMMPALAASPAPAFLMAAMAGWGAAASCFDVAINAIGAAQEKAAGRSTMSKLHAGFCAGMLAGALLGSAAAAAGISALPHSVMVTLLLALALLLAVRALPPDGPVNVLKKERLTLPRGPLIVLGMICFCGAMAEGSIADWSGVFMADQLLASDGIAPLAFAGFSAWMLLARLYGDRLKDRFGARRVVGIGAAIAAAGLLLALLAIDVPLTITGFALAGAGLAGLFPFVFSAAARHGPTALAGVATMGYGGMLIGPPVIGVVAHGFGLQAAIGIIGMLSMAAAIASCYARGLE
jgi:MFS family permease